MPDSGDPGARRRQMVAAGDLSSRRRPAAVHRAETQHRRGEPADADRGAARPGTGRDRQPDHVPGDTAAGRLRADPLGETLRDAAGTLVSWADARLAEVDAARAADDARSGGAAIGQAPPIRRLPG